MGIGMAFNLQKHLQETKQPSLHYSNRTLSKGESLKTAGGVEEPNYAALVKSCDIIFTMVGHFLTQYSIPYANTVFRFQMTKYLIILWTLPYQPVASWAKPLLTHPPYTPIL